MRSRRSVCMVVGRTIAARSRTDVSSVCQWRGLTAKGQVPGHVTRSCDCVARRSSCRWDSQKRLQWLGSVLDETRRNEASPYRRVAVCGSCGRDTGEIAPPDPVPARRLGWKNRMPSTPGASEGRPPKVNDAVASGQQPSGSGTHLRSRALAVRGTARGRVLQLIIHGSGFKFLGGEIQGTEQHRAARLMDELKRDQRCSERSTVGARDKEEIPRRMREQVSPSLPGRVC